MSAENMRYNFNLCGVEARQASGEWWLLPWATDLAIVERSLGGG